MSNVKGTLLAGYYIAYPGTYFNKVLIVSELAQHPDTNVAAVRDRWMGELKESGGQFVAQIRESEKVAQHLGIGMPPLPRFPQDYFSWAENSMKAFLEKFPISTPEGLGFQLGFHLANMASDLSIIKACLHMQQETAGVIDKTAQVHHLVKDAFNSDMLCGGTAMLLARQSGKNEIHQQWMTLSSLLKSAFPQTEPVINAETMPALIDKTQLAFDQANTAIKTAVSSF